MAIPEPANREPADVDTVGRSTGQPQPTRLLVAGLVSMMLGIVGGLLIGGEVSHAVSPGAGIGPFVLLAGLLQLGRTRSWARQLAWAWFWLLLLTFGVGTLALIAFALDPSLQAEDRSGERTRALLVAGALLLLVLTATMVLVASGRWLSIATRLGGSRELGGSAHAQAVVGLLAFTLIACVPLVALAGEAPFLRILAEDPTVLDVDRSTSGQVLDLAYALCWTLLLALVAAGAPGCRGARAALKRLGILRLDARDLARLVGITAGLLVLGTALDRLTFELWGWAEWPRTSAEDVERLFAWVGDSTVTAVGAGVTAGVSEEIIARGLLQTRLGWLLPNLAFTAMHAFQYGTDALVGVFVTGAALAWVRARWNTTAAIFVHALYDVVLFVASLLELPFF